MRILMVSMKSIHFERWTNQLKDSGHEVFWFDVNDGGRTSKLPWVTQITGWKKGFLKKRGRTFLKKYVPNLHRWLSNTFDTPVEKAFEQTLKEVQPDVVHSFVLYISCVPILEVMQQHPKLPWIYSSWGSDLYYFKEIETYRRDIERVLPRIDYLFTDCARDQQLAKDMGFQGTSLGVFPGGGGYDFQQMNPLIKPFSERQLILVKGYQGRSGRAIPVLKALQALEDKLKPYKIVVFGADTEVVDFIRNTGIANHLPLQVYSREDFLPHQEILSLMGQAMLYIGNSNSDGMPNTVLEAICMGAFPIQSNPGGVSEEVIEAEMNGLLIEKVEDVGHIANQIEKTLADEKMRAHAYAHNLEIVKPCYEIGRIRASVLKQYDLVKQKLNN